MIKIYENDNNELNESVVGLVATLWIGSTVIGHIKNDIRNYRFNKKLYESECKVLMGLQTAVERVNNGEKEVDLDAKAFSNLVKNSQFLETQIALGGVAKCVLKIVNGLKNKNVNKIMYNPESQEFELK